jgi:hypothetical protein
VVLNSFRRGMILTNLKLLIKSSAAIIALIACHWVSPSAQGGCGDYGPPMATTANAPSGSQHVPMHDRDSHSGKRKPCNGPECSNRSSLPPMAPVTPVRVLNDLAAIFGLETFAFESGATATLDDHRRPTSAFISALFRPPRLLSSHS